MKTIAFEITDKCQMSCPHCIKRWRKQFIGDMGYEIINQLLRYTPAENYIINGGEPALAMDKVRYFIDHAPPANISINTNLAAMTYQDLDYLVSKNIYFNISLTNAYQSMHQDKIVNNLGYLKDYPRKCVMSLVLRGNDFAKDLSLDVYNTRAVIGLPIPSGVETYTIGEATKRLTMIDLYKKLSMRHVTLFLPVPLCWLPKGFSVECFHVCIAGAGRIMLTPDGVIRPCGCLPENIIGHISTKQLQEFKKNDLRPKECLSCIKNKECHPCTGMLYKSVPVCSFKEEGE